MQASLQFWLLTYVLYKVQKRVEEYTLVCRAALLLSCGLATNQFAFYSAGLLLQPDLLFSIPLGSSQVNCFAQLFERSLPNT